MTQNPSDRPRTLGDAWKPGPNLTAHIGEILKASQASVAPEALARIADVATALQTNDATVAAVQRTAQQAANIAGQVLAPHTAQTVRMLAEILNETSGSYRNLMREIADQYGTSPVGQEHLAGLRAILLQLRGAMDVVVEAEPAETFTDATAGATTAVARPGDWGISRAAAKKILTWLGSGIGATMTVDALIRELVGDEPSPAQVIYWSAAIVAMTVVVIIASVRPSEWRQDDDRDDPDDRQA